MSLRSLSPSFSSLFTLLSSPFLSSLSSLPSLSLLPDPTVSPLLSSLPLPASLHPPPPPIPPSHLHPPPHPNPKIPPAALVQIPPPPPLPFSQATRSGTSAPDHPLTLTPALLKTHPRGYAASQPASQPRLTYESIEDVRNVRGSQRTRDEGDTRRAWEARRAGV